MHERITDYLNFYVDKCTKLPRWLGAFLVGTLFITVTSMVALLFTLLLWIAFYLWGFIGLVMFGLLIFIYVVGYIVLG